MLRTNMTPAQQQKLDDIVARLASVGGRLKHYEKLSSLTHSERYNKLVCLMQRRLLRLNLRKLLKRVDNLPEHLQRLL